MKLNPILTELEKGEIILIAGAGGGFDVFSGLPLYFYLKAAGKTVHLANLTFTNLLGVTGDWISDSAVVIDENSGGSMGYFPERYLCHWFSQCLEPVKICCFDRNGPVALRADYVRLCERHHIDTIVLVDGGTDSLMRGDETGLGTPHEDISSIIAANEAPAARKFLLSIGFGVDAFHGVNHFQFLEAVAALTKAGGFLGTLTLLDEMPEVQRFKEAYRFVAAMMPAMPSIVTSSIIAAIEGHYGNVHPTNRTAGSTLWINPLMPIYWGFQLEAVAKRCLYYDAARKARSMFELDLCIDKFRAGLPKTRPWDEIPC